MEMCHYQGVVRGFPGSWAAISTCSGGVTGVFFDGREMHYVEKPNTGDLDKQDLHYIYKHSDLAENNKTCGYGGDAYDHSHFEDHSRISRVSTVRVCMYNTKNLVIALTWMNKRLLATIHVFLQPSVDVPGQMLYSPSAVRCDNCCGRTYTENRFVNCKIEMFINWMLTVIICY